MPGQGRVRCLSALGGLRVLVRVVASGRERAVRRYGWPPVPSKTMSWPQRSNTWPCGLAKPIGDVGVELLGARLEAVDAGVGLRTGGPHGVSTCVWWKMPSCK